MDWNSNFTPWSCNYSCGLTREEGQTCLLAPNTLLKYLSLFTSSPGTPHSFPSSHSSSSIFLQVGERVWVWWTPHQNLVLWLSSSPSNVVFASFFSIFESPFFSPFSFKLNPWLLVVWSCSCEIEALGVYTPSKSFVFTP